MESTGQLKVEAHQLYRLIKRVELLVSDLQPYAMRSKSTLEACGYDLEGAFWQSSHAIAGEVRHRWDDPGRSDPSSRHGEARRPRAARDDDAGRPFLFNAQLLLIKDTTPGL